ncbi:MAG: TonB-dependent receptor [Bdellovibrionales bacterium]|nr:TonB-dependent receptor [Bdellovibrionales bacterium]
MTSKIRHFKARLLFVALLAGLKNLQAFAQVQIEPVVITASRIETPEAEVSQSITVIEPSESDRQSGRAVYELLRDVPGVSVVNSGGVGQLSSVYIRGSGSQQTLVLMDGVLMNDPSAPGRSYDFGRLSAHQVERIEILNGSSSGVHGSNATGGVINIITKKEFRDRSAVFAEYGSFNTKRLSATHSAVIKKTRLNLGASIEDSTGFPSASVPPGSAKNNGFSRQSLTLSSISPLSPTWSLKGALRGYRSKSDVPYSGGVAGQDPNYPQKESQGSGKLQLEYSGAEYWEPSISLSYFQSERNTENRQDYGVYQGNRIRLEQLNRIFWNDSITWIFGIDSQIERASIEEKYNGTLTQMPTEAQVATGAFAENRWRSGNVFGSAAIRADVFHGTTHQFTYRLGSGYVFPRSATTLKASVGRGFTAPSLDQIHSSTYGNPRLNAEVSQSYEGTIQQKFGSLIEIQSTYFLINFSNLIFGDSSDNYRYKNISAAKNQGLESALRWKPRSFLNLTLSHTFLSAKNLENGKQLNRRPTHSAAISLQGTHGGNFQWNFKGRFTGTRFDDSANTVRMPSFTAFSADSSWKFLKNTAAFAKIENILDKRYEEVAGYQTASRSLYVGVMQEF